MRKKRILAVLLSSAIAFSGMPGNVFAAEDVALEDGFSDGETADVTENPTEEEIIHYLTGNLCRCTGYMGQLRAIKTYMGVK